MKINYLRIPLPKRQILIAIMQALSRPLNRMFLLEPIKVSKDFYWGRTLELYIDKIPWFFNESKKQKKCRKFPEILRMQSVCKFWIQWRHEPDLKGNKMKGNGIDRLKYRFGTLKLNHFVVHENLHLLSVHSFLFESLELTRQDRDLSRLEFLQHFELLFFHFLLYH